MSVDDGDDRVLYLAMGGCAILIGGIIAISIPDYVTLGQLLVGIGICVIVLEGIFKCPIPWCKGQQEEKEEIDTTIRGFPGLKGLLSLYEDPFTHKLVPLDSFRQCEWCEWFSATGDCTRCPVWAHITDPTEHQCGEFLADPILLHPLIDQEKGVREA